MSCRVFNREFEYAVFDYLIEQARAKGIERLKVKFIKTAKNGYIGSLYDRLGFTVEKIKDDSKDYIFHDIRDYERKNRFIKVRGS
ncbi:MAG: hypothetical protein V6Z86_08815 [Hyphomicrobiales bacterium]